MGLIIGLTGGIGSGKTTVADKFGALGAVLVDADLIAHQLTAAGGAAIEPIAQAFGRGVIAENGSLDRAAMRTLVFNDAKQRQRLEAILHPAIRAESDRQIAAVSGSGPGSAPYVMTVIPLLVESASGRGRANRVAVVDCPRELQIVRVMKRSALSRPEVEAILNTQASREQRLAAADDVIDNSGEPAALDARIAELHLLYIGLAAASAAN